jgi:membrane peptidoglycan carboxypeptidase
MAEKIVAAEVSRSEYLQLSNGATLISNPKNGDILAMVGSKDYLDETNGKVNLTTSLRQPGSTVKVITYSAALMNNFTAATILDDSPTIFQNDGAVAYAPVNYDGRYFGKVTLRFALANSLNLPAVKTLQKVGIPEVLSLAKKMGINTWDTPERYGLSLTLGGAETTMLDMATTFGTLSNGGEKVDLNPILLVTDYKGNVLEQKSIPNPIRALPKGVAYIISDILRDNKTRSTAFGSNSPLTIPDHTVAVKTGTSDNKRDNWTIGYTNDYVVTVWVGNNDNSPMSQSLASGITGAAPIWHDIMTNLLKNTHDTPILAPSDVTVKSCMGRNEYFLKGTENTVFCNNNQEKKSFSIH